MALKKKLGYRISSERWLWRQQINFWLAIDLPDLRFIQRPKQDCWVLTFPSPNRHQSGKFLFYCSLRLTGIPPDCKMPQSLVSIPPTFLSFPWWRSPFIRLVERLCLHFVWIPSHRERASRRRGQELIFVVLREWVTVPFPFWRHLSLGERRGEELTFRNVSSQ